MKITITIPGRQGGSLRQDTLDALNDLLDIVGDGKRPPESGPLTNDDGEHVGEYEIEFWTVIPSTK